MNELFGINAGQGAAQNVRLFRQAIDQGIATRIQFPPAIHMALTVAKAQLERGEQPTPNITATLVLYLDFLMNGDLDVD